MTRLLQCLYDRMKRGRDEGADLKISVTPDPETELKPKHYQSACEVIVQGTSYIFSTLSCYHEIFILI